MKRAAAKEPRRPPLPRGDHVLFPNLAVTRQRGSVRVENAALGLSLTVPAEAWSVLARFRRPAPLDRALRESGGRSAGLDAFLRQCVEHQLLVPAAQREFLAGGLLASPEPAEIFYNTALRLKGLADLTGKRNVVFLGVPFDLGAPIAGARQGPFAIRRESRHLSSPELDPISGGEREPYYDLYTGEAFLRDVRMYDVGDVVVRHGEPVRFPMERLKLVVGRILDRGALPVIMGGDHSITASVIETFTSRPELPEIGVCHFDAHPDLAPVGRDGRINHANFMSRVVAHRSVAALAQFGCRTWVGRSTLELSRRHRIVRLSVDQLRARGIKEALKSLPRSLPYYLSIDIDVLDPSVAPATTTPLHGGLQFHELRDALIAFIRARTVIGIDLVEVLDAPPPNLTARAAADLLLACVGAWSR